jgi:hypothetical protein
MEKIFGMVTFGRMRNDPREADSIPASRIAMVAKELEMFAQTLRLAEEVAQQQPGKSLSMFYWTAVDATLKRVASFVRAADESRRQAQLGKPIESGQLKPRSTAKTAIDSDDDTAEIDDMVAEVEGKLGKATPKPRITTKKQGKRKAE